MSVRGAAHRSAIREVLRTFGTHANEFVFVGGCVLGLYARPSGAPLRVTTDVDCISTVEPWVRQERLLAELCEQGVLAPDANLQCRYVIKSSGIVVDVLSPDGFNVGGVNPWFRKAAQRAQSYELEPGTAVRAISPPYFLLTKLAAFLDRGPDPESSKDLEDIVTLALEVPTLWDAVQTEGVGADVAELWNRAFERYQVEESDMPDVVDAHLDSRDREHRERVLATLRALSHAPQ